MTRYTRVAIGLHWLIAAAIVANMVLGWWMSDAIDDTASRDSAVTVFQWHKSIGLTILVLSLIRLLWRILNPAPPLSDGMPAWERRVASLTHAAFYALMIGIPLSGWVYVSTQWRGNAPLTIPTLWFEWFEVPHLFALNEASHALRQAVADLSVESHEVLVWAMLLLLLLHVGAAIRHRFVLHDDLLARMMPWLDTSLADAPLPEPKKGMRRHWLAGLTLLAAAAFVVIGTRSTVAPQLPADAAAMSAALAEFVANDSRKGNWQVSADNNAIRFSGRHVGRAFNGKFTQWQAVIRFDPAAPEQALITAVINTASATDGVPMHDSTLPEAEWFDVSAHPFAYYRVTRVKQTAENHYALYGQLTIKNHRIELTPLTLTVQDDTLKISGKAPIDRAAVHMGMESDPAGDYVSRDINIHIDISALPNP